MKFKLGKKHARHDEKNPRFASYLFASALPPIPAASDWGESVPDWLMLGNDTVGDCTCAAMAHGEMEWAADTARVFTPSADDTLAVYSAITGYDPSQTDSDGNNPSDTGADVVDVLNYWKNTGFCGRKIAGYSEINPKNSDHVKLSIALLGGAYFGVQLPQSAMDAINAGQPWIDTTDTNILGGHAIWAVAYDADGVTFVTWGREVFASWEWISKYADEAFAIPSADWINSSGVSPSGLNISQLIYDSQEL